MKTDSYLKSLTQSERINFLLTNRIPRRYATIFMGWFSKIEHPLISRLSLAIWRYFANDLDLSESRKMEFKSLHDCFIRQLKPDARIVDPDPRIITSPCDAIIGSYGHIDGTTLLQTKGFPYKLEELLLDDELVKRYQDGSYITLRLKSTMYHRFHAPQDCHVSKIDYISGDTWNVNPIALKRIERLFCKNERAVIDLQLATPDCHITLVPVAAILVAGIKLHCLPEVLDLRYQGPNRLECDTSFKKGEEMGYFQHGSTIIIFANQKFSFVKHLQAGKIIKTGQPLLKLRDQ